MNSNECVSSCPFNTYLDNFPRPLSCLLCNKECLGGCIGPTASECSSCLHFFYKSACVGACPSGFAPSVARTCQACDSECLGNCTIPADPSACVSCSQYQDQGVCVAACPLARMFLFDGVCTSSCPPGAPFYNDTRSDPILPSVCVADCHDLGDPLRVHLGVSAPYMCTTAELAAAEASSSSSSLPTWAIVLLVVGCVVAATLLLAIVLALVRRHHHRHLQKTISRGDFSLNMGNGNVNEDGVYHQVRLHGTAGGHGAKRILSNQSNMLNSPPGDVSNVGSPSTPKLYSGLPHMHVPPDGSGSIHSYLEVAPVFDPSHHDDLDGWAAGYSESENSFMSPSSISFNRSMDGSHHGGAMESTHV